MANCSNCSGPLPKNSVVCTYCGTRNDVDLKGIHYNTVNDIDEERICPRCNIPLKTIDLGINGKFYIEKCDECHGMFFDPGELQAVLDNEVDTPVVQRKMLNNIKKLNDSGKEVQYSSQYIKCPICQKFMNRKSYAYKTGVIVNSCKDDGIWLDNSQLRSLLEWKKLGGETLAKEREERLQKQEEKEKFRKIKDMAEAKGQDYGTQSKFYAKKSSSNGDFISTLIDFFS